MPPPSETSVPVNSGGSDPVASPPKLFNLSSLQPLARHSSCPSLKTNAAEQKKSPKGPAVITSSSSSVTVTKDSLPTGKSNREDVTSPAYSDISDPNDQSTPLLDADFDQKLAGKMEGKAINPVAGPSDPEIPSEPLSMYSFYQLPPYLPSKSEDSVSKPEEKKESLGPARLEKAPVTPVLRNDSPSLPTPVESKDAANGELKTVAVADINPHPSSTSMVVPACPSGSSSPSSEEKEFSNVFQQIERQFEEEQRTIGHYSGGGGDFDHRTVPESASMFPPRMNPHHFQSPSPGSQFGSGWMFNGPTSSPLKQMLQQQQQQFQQHMLQQQQMMMDQSTAQQWMQENCQKLQRLQQYHEQPRQPQQPQQPQHKSLALSKTSMPSSASNHRPRPSAVDLEQEQRNKNQQGPPTGSSSGAGMSPYGISPNFHPYGLQFDPGFVNTFSSMMGGSPDPFGPVAGSSHYGVPRHPQPGFDELEMLQRQRLAQYYAATSPPAQIGASSATSMGVEGSSQQQQQHQSHQHNFHHQNSVPTSSAVPSNPSATRANSQGCKLSKKRR